MSRDPVQQVIRAGSRRRRRRLAALVLALGVLAAAAPPAGAFDLGRLSGHLSIGYADLVIKNAPGGSLSLGGGLDYPIAPRLREGLDIGFSLYGSRSFDHGPDSFDATLDYSSLDIVAFTHWEPAHGPFARISLGPGVGLPRAALSATAGSGEFLDLAVHDVAPAAALDLTIMRHRPAPVRVALVLGALGMFRSGEDWYEISARLGFHY